jgi:RNA polymerase sigma-70 factor (ECF subfamily)
VAAETFLIAWRRLDDVPPHEAALPWLLVTARRVLANRRRATDRATTMAPLLEADVNGAGGLDPADAVAERAALAAAFRRLDETDRETLALVAWDGLAPREAAVVAGCSAATFAVRAHRAKRRLASLLAEEDASHIGTTRRSS